MSDKMNIDMGKNYKEEILINCNMKIELFDKDGNIKEIRNVHNTVTTAGKNGVMECRRF